MANLANLNWHEWLFGELLNTLETVALFSLRKGLLETLNDLIPSSTENSYSNVYLLHCR